jgi:hypothetical protein
MSDEPDVRERQLSGLSRIVELAREARAAADAARLGFLMVNDTQRLTPYRQAVWLAGDDRRLRAQAVSGLPDVDVQAPFIDWFTRMLRAEAPKHSSLMFALTADDVDDAPSWHRWLPAHLLAIRLTNRAGQPVGILALARDEPFADGDQVVLSELAGIYAHAALGLGVSGRRRFGLRSVCSRLALVAVMAAVVAAMVLVDVKQTALGEAEVVAAQPLPVRAPLDGVVEQIHVTPNQRVEPGTTLVTFDATSLQNQATLAEKALEVAEAEYRQMAQAALFDSRSKAQLVALKGRAEQRAGELQYVTGLLSRITVTAPRQGIAVFADASDWIGRSVTIGEGIMVIADERDVALEMQLPVADAMTLEPGTRMRLFLNVDPLNPLDATLSHAAYRATATPDGVMAYRLKGEFDGDVATPRIGLRGTAKIYGEPVSLGYFLFRRPLATLRRWLGL